MTLTPEELDTLRAKGQRFRLYLATWDSWVLNARFPKLIKNEDTANPRPKLLGTFKYNDYDPIINMGPHRLGFIGEPLTFDSSLSFKVPNDDNMPSSMVWSFSGGSPSTASGPGPHEVEWAAPGLYEVTCTNNETSGKRWVRILQDRLTTDWDVIEVGSVQGSVEGGWSCQVTVQPNDDGKQGVQQLNVDNFQHVGLFVEEEWETEEHEFARMPMGHYRNEPRLVISGVIMQGSAQFDANTHKVSFTIGSVVDQLNLGYVRQTQSASKKYVQGENVEDSIFGIILDVDEMRMPEIMLWWLQKYTNLLDKHDFLTWWPGSLQDLETVSSPDSNSLWGSMSAWAQSEYFWLFVDEGNAIHYEPNPHIRSISGWNERHPITMTFTDQDILDLQVRKDLSKNVSYVQVKATKPSKDKAFVAYYPNRNPSAGPGTWTFVDGLIAQKQSYVDNLAERIFRDANRKFEITISTGINRMIAVPDKIALTIAIPELDIDWTDKVFIVDSVSHSPNLQDGSWQTQIVAREEILNE